MQGESYSTTLREDEKDKFSGWEMVVFHIWLRDSCLVYSTVLLFLELNKEHHEPVSDCVCPSFFHHIKTFIKILLTNISYFQEPF